MYVAGSRAYLHAATSYSGASSIDSTMPGPSTLTSTHHGVMDGGHSVSLNSSLDTSSSLNTSGEVVLDRTVASSAIGPDLGQLLS